MKVSELTGPELCLWVARADGRKAKLLHPGTPINGVIVRETACFVLTEGYADGWWQPFVPTYWGVAGDLMDKFDVTIGKFRESPSQIYAEAGRINQRWREIGNNRLTVVLRAIVGSVYGPTVRDEPTP